MKKRWFEGSNIIECSIGEIENIIKNHGSFFTDVASFMPGITNVELLEEGKDHVIIKTNEGIMKRTNIKKRHEPNKVVIEFDEEYQARMVTANSHYVEEFITSEDGVNHRTIIGDVKAPGLLGFFYRSFGSANIGKAVLKSFKTYLEMSRD